MTVYLIIENDPYDGKRILSAFLDKGKAEAYFGKLKQDQYRKYLLIHEQKVIA